MNFLLLSLIGIMVAAAQQSGRVNLRNVIARALLEHRKRGADDNVLAEAILFDEDEEIEIKRARNTWQRPGGSNATGHTDYRGSRELTMFFFGQFPYLLAMFLLLLRDLPQNQA